MNETDQQIPLTRRLSIVAATIGVLGLALVLTLALAGRSATAQVTLQPEEAAEGEHGEGPDDEEFEHDDDFDEDHEAFEICADSIWEGHDDVDADVEDLDERIIEECLPLLPEIDQAFFVALVPFEECVEAELGDLDDIELEEEFDESVFEAAEQACAALLPPELVELEAAWAAFDECLVANGVDVDHDEEFDEAAVVFVGGPDDERLIELGSGPATVTITSDGSSVDVVTTGDVIEIEIEEDFDVEDEAFEACEVHLPDEAMILDGFAVDLDD